MSHNLQQSNGAIPRTDTETPAGEPHRDQGPRCDPFPHWPERAVAVLNTYDRATHATPVASLLRAGDRRILFSLHRTQGSPERLREWTGIALTVLGDSGTSFTARGRARVVVDSLVGQPDFAAVELHVEVIDDHRRCGYSIAVCWSDDRELEALRKQISALQWLAA